RTSSWRALRHHRNRGTVAWARYCATAASQTARTGQPRTRAAASASASSAVAVPKPAGPSAVPATLTVTTWLLPGGPTSTATDVREAVSRFIRDQRTPSVPVWAKIAAATARRTGSAHRAVRTCPGRPWRPTIGGAPQAPAPAGRPARLQDRGPQPGVEVVDGALDDGHVTLAQVLLRAGLPDDHPGDVGPVRSVPATAAGAHRAYRHGRKTARGGHRR